jgi:hypothetical protein
MLPENQLDTIYINQGDDYEFYFTPSYTIANCTYESAIVNTETGVLAGNWDITNDLALNRVYMKLSDTQTSLWTPDKYIFDIKEADATALPIFYTHPMWGYIILEASIT